MIKLTETLEEELIKLSEESGVFLEGNILKTIDPSTENFKEYIAVARERDAVTRKKRLEITKQIQRQNKDLDSKAKELQTKAEENDALMIDLKEALSVAEGAKKAALDDLDLLQRKTQFELIGNIVKVALWTIMAVGITTTALYVVALFLNGNGPDTTLIGNTWSNLLGILLTNSFSIIGTIMGVKYASESQQKKKENQE